MADPFSRVHFIRSGAELGRNAVSVQRWGMHTEEESAYVTFPPTVTSAHVS